MKREILSSKNIFWQRYLEKKNMANFIFFSCRLKTFKNCETSLLVATIDYILPFLVVLVLHLVFEWMQLLVNDLIRVSGFWLFELSLLSWLLQVCCGGVSEGRTVLVVDLVLDCVAFLLLLWLSLSLFCFIFYWSFTWGVASLVSFEVEVGNVSSGCVIFRSLSSNVPWSDIMIGDWFLSIKRSSFSKI